MKRVLVTGGAGFLGAQLCRLLLDHGEQVICVDDLSTGRTENLRGLLKHENIEFWQHDVIEPLDLKVDQIYNLACPASPQHYLAEPVKTLRTNFQGTLNILELASQNQARVLHASTSEVYGDPEIHPQSENYLGLVDPIGPRSCYDEGKRVSESLCFAYQRSKKIEVRVARIFNTYGPGMAADDGRVVTNFVNQALNNRDITIYGDGSQTRSFCYVDDLLVALYRLMNLKTEEPVGPVNLGNPEEVSMLDLAHCVLALSDSNSRIVKKPLPQSDPRRRCPDITLARKLLSWKPEVSLREGLEKTIAYFAATLKP